MRTRQKLDNPTIITSYGHVIPGNGFKQKKKTPQTVIVKLTYMYYFYFPCETPRWLNGKGRGKASNGEAMKNDGHLVKMQRKEANSSRKISPLLWGSKRPLVCLHWPLDSQVWYFLQPYVPPLVAGHTAATVRRRKCCGVLTAIIICILRIQLWQLTNGNLMLKYGYVFPF